MAQHGDNLGDPRSSGQSNLFNGLQRLLSGIPQEAWPQVLFSLTPRSGGFFPLPGRIPIGAFARPGAIPTRFVTTPGAQAAIDRAAGLGPEPSGAPLAHAQMPFGAEAGANVGLPVGGRPPTRNPFNLGFDGPGSPPPGSGVPPPFLPGRSSATIGHPLRMELLPTGGGARPGGGGAPFIPWTQFPVRANASGPPSYSWVPPGYPGIMLGTPKGLSWNEIVITATTRRAVIFREDLLAWGRVTVDKNGLLRAPEIYFTPQEAAVMRSLGENPSNYVPPEFLQFIELRDVYGNTSIGLPQSMGQPPPTITHPPGATSPLWNYPPGEPPLTPLPPPGFSPSPTPPGKDFGPVDPGLDGWGSGSDWGDQNVMDVADVPVYVTAGGNTGGAGGKAQA